MSAERLLTTAEVMEQLGCSRTFLTEHAAELGGRKVGTRLKFLPADIAAYLDRRRVQDRAQPQSKPAPVQARRLSVVGQGAINPRTGRPWDYLKESSR